MPRPTRSLLDLQESLKSFANIAKGNVWRGNNQLQINFEADNPAKTGNVSENGSGGRTWASLLKVYGLWYDDGNVTITSAGRVIIEGRFFYQQVVHQILNFQLRSPYSEHQRLEPTFKIFPFRIILKMLLDKKINFLEQAEIALFLLNMQTPSDFELAKEQILKYRKEKNNGGKELKDRTDLIRNHMETHRPSGRTDTPDTIAGHWRYINTDLANTFFNHIKFIHEIHYDETTKIISIDDRNYKNMQDILEKHEREYPFSIRDQFGERAFYEHYGLDFNRHKATTKRTKPKTREAKLFEKINKAFDDIMRRTPKTDVTKLIQKIVDKTAIRPEDITEIIQSNPDAFDLTSNSGLDASFIEYYKECGKSGVDDQDFEKMTRDMFTDLGFCTKKEAFTGGGDVDGLILNSKILKSGILECKSGKKYSLPIQDKDKMIHTYIAKRKERKKSGKTYRLDYFVYVVGNNFAGVRNFKNILCEQEVPGTVIMAHDLLVLYGLVKQQKISNDKFWNLFKKKKILSIADFK